MKHIIVKTAVLVVVACFTSCQLKTEQKAESINQEVEDENNIIGEFGDKVTDENIVSTGELITRLSSSDSVVTKIHAEILQTCAMKGCWMKVRMPEGDNMRVSFKDYGFFVPTEGMEGKEAIIEGYAKKVTTDVATLRHYAEDAGKSAEEVQAITEPKEEYAFVASGVVIRESSSKK